VTVECMPPRGVNSPRGDQFVEDAVDHVLVKHARVAETLEVELQTFEFHAQFVRDILDRDRAEVRLTCLRADAREFRRDVRDNVVAFRVRIVKRFQWGHAMVLQFFNSNRPEFVHEFHKFHE